MAAMGLTGARFVPILAVFFSLEYISGTSLQWKDPNLLTQADGWSKTITKDLKSLTEVLVNNMENEYNKDLPKDMKVEDNNGEKLVNEMAMKLEKMLGNKMKALEKLVRAAEKAVNESHWNQELKMGDVHYWNAKSDLQGILKYNERFLQPINETVSTVHIPVEIYNGNIDILNGLQWSNALDEAFKKNYEEDEDMLWQYFGSQTGFMRTFPGSQWSTNKDEVDLFDVRRRPWYTQGSSSPKTMLILIDTSGSVHGQALSLIKVAVKSILDTLGENDFVNVANFSKNVSYVSCFKTFVQANYRNKKILREGVDSIHALDMANFEKALTFAFDEFDKFNMSDPGEKCNRMIMLLTDGGTDDAEAVFKARNFNAAPKDQIRVFTYAVGQTANPTRGIKWMACANRGKFAEIPAMGAIRARVQEYTFILSETFRPERPLWSRVYFDKTGLGMMTTVTLPVYNRTDANDRNSNQTILGVMGTDVTTAQMQKFSPFWKLGPNGYSFAINANGYVMFHPRLKVHEDFKDPPNMDFLDIEVENEDKVQLRVGMTNGLSGRITMDTYVISADNNHTDLETRHYFYTNVKNTSFSLGLSIPSYQGQVLMFTDTPGNLLKNGSNFIDDGKTAILVAPWKYVKNGAPPRNLSDVYEAYKEWENKGRNATYWDNERILHLHWDLTKTGHLNDVYRMYLVNKTEAIFVATYGGLTRLVPPSSKHKKRLEADRDTWKAAYFRRALDFDGNIFTAPYTLGGRKENDSIPDIMITNSITMKTGIRPAVVGGFVKHDKLLEIMATRTGQTCQEDSTTVCYLLDDGGFIVATNQKEDMLQVGRFFGRHDAVLMHDLYNVTEAYKRVEHFDYQATCTRNDNSTSSAIRLRVPSINLLFEFLTFNWWSSIWTWWVSNLSLYSWMNSPVVEASNAPDSNKNCIKKQAQYYFNPDFSNNSGEIDCVNNCTRNYIAIKLQKTNLMFVLTNKKCTDCILQFKEDLDLLQEPEEFTDETAHFCAMKPRYRRVTEPCYDYHEKEKDDCGGPLTTPVSVAVIVIATIITVVCTYIR